MITLIPDYCDLCAGAKNKADRIEHKREIFLIMLEMISAEQGHCQLFDPATPEGQSIEEAYIDLYDLYKEMEVNCALCAGDGCRIKAIVEEYIRDTVDAYRECCQLVNDEPLPSQGQRPVVVPSDRLERHRRLKRLSKNK